MNEIIKLETEFKRIKSIYLEKRNAINVNDSNHFTIPLSYSRLSKEFSEKEAKKIIAFAEDLIKNTSDEKLKNEISSKTELFLTEFAFSLIYS